MNTGPIALLTDFGFDFAVASMKGVILQRHPKAHIIDVDHSIKKFCVLSGAFIIEKVHAFFPMGTLFVCVVDPGVGSTREAICVEYNGQVFFGPNNGLFHHLIKKGAVARKIKDEYFAPEFTTFHGRDIFAPAAAEYQLGKRDFLSPLAPERVQVLDTLEKDHIAVYIDSFGNIKTNIPVPSQHGDSLSFIVREEVHHIPFTTTFSTMPEGALLCYRGSNNTIEIAANKASGKDVLGIDVGDAVQLLN